MKVRPIKAKKAGPSADLAKASTSLKKPKTEFTMRLKILPKRIMQKARKNNRFRVILLTNDF